MELLRLAGVNVVVNDRLVRGLDYYNGTCFEIKCLQKTSVLGASQDTVLAGGRYDNLSSQYIGKSVPAFGWAAGIDRLSLLLQEFSVPKPPIKTKTIGVVSHLDSTELQYGPQLRQLCFELN